MSAKVFRKLSEIVEDFLLKKFTAVVVSLLVSGAVFAQSKMLDKSDAFYVYLKGSKTVLSEKDQLDYAKTFESDIYNKYKNDEFEWDEQFSNIKDSLKTKVENADMDSVYSISTSVQFGDYNFANEGFNVTIGEGTFFPFDRFENWFYLERGSIFQKRMALKLDSFEKYNFIGMPKAEAKTFLQSRKDSYGNVNREVTVQIKYKLASFDSAEYKSFKDLALSNNYLPLVEIIESIDVYDTSNRNNIKKIGELVRK